MKNTLKHVLLAVAATVLTLAFAEIAVRVFVPIRMVGSSVTVYDSVYGHALKRNAQIRQITPEYTMRAHKLPRLSGSGAARIPASIDTISRRFVHIRTRRQRW